LKKSERKNGIRIRTRKENYKKEQNERTKETRAGGGNDKVLQILRGT
jgi:hypothetical protein